MKKYIHVKQGIICEAFILLVVFSIFIYDRLEGNVASTLSESITMQQNQTDDVKPNGEKEYIKWVEFNVTYSALEKAYEYDVATFTKQVHVNWIELLAYLGAKYGGDFKQYKQSDLDMLVERLVKNKESMDSIVSQMKHYKYYLEAYSAILSGLVGEYEIEIDRADLKETDVVVDNVDEAKEQVQPNDFENKIQNEIFQSQETPKENKVIWVKRYGLKGYLPIAKNFPYNDYDDFGVSRSFGYKRRHLGHDMMGQVGTPIVAVESGYVEAIGWNRYGGWRLGIRSFDKKRYYYYAHLRRNFPYCKELKEGTVVTAGDVIGYMGRTGYSDKENVNNIDTSHLHIGLQLIFDESQKEGNNEIWVDCYNLVRFLYQNRSETRKEESTKEWRRVYRMRDPAVTQYKKEKGIQ